MITYLLRHGQTTYSSSYRVNGDPTVPVPLDETGIRACQEARDLLPAEIVRTWVTSAFPRAQQTSELLRGTTVTAAAVEPLLNELDYGTFESGPFQIYASWLQEHGPSARPDGARESQHEGIRRMLTGVRATLALTGPRCVVAHGLLLSVLYWKCSNPWGAAMPVFFPEAPCLVPFAAADADLEEWVSDLITEIDDPSGDVKRPEGDSTELRTGAEPVFATVDPLALLEEKDPHA